MSPPTPCTPRPHAEGRRRQGLLAVGSGSVGTSTRGHRPGPGRAILSSAGGRGLRRRQLCPVLRAHRNACRDSGGGVGALSARAGRDCLGVSSAPSFLRASQRAGRTDGRRPGQEGLARPAHAHHGTLTGRGAPLHKGRRAEPVSDRPKQASGLGPPPLRPGLRTARAAPSRPHSEQLGQLAALQGDQI